MADLLDGRTINVNSENYTPAVKKPAFDAYLYHVNFIPWLPTGVTLVSATSAVVTDGTGTPPTTSGVTVDAAATGVDILVSGGSAEWTGRISVRGLGTDGQKKRQQFAMTITADDVTA